MIVIRSQFLMGKTLVQDETATLSLASPKRKSERVDVHLDLIKRQ